MEKAKYIIPQIQITTSCVFNILEASGGDFNPGGTPDEWAKERGFFDEEENDSESESFYSNKRK